MTAEPRSQRAVLDPVGLVVDLVVDLVAQPAPDLDADTVAAVVQQVAAGRAKRRRLATALLERPAVLTTGRSPGPRVIGDLLIALRAAGAASIASGSGTGAGVAALGKLTSRDRIDMKPGTCMATVR